jgi:hypothetical protein
MTRGMKLSPSARFVYDCVFSWVAVVACVFAACVLVDDPCCTIFEKFKLFMTTFTNVR